MVRSGPAADAMHSLGATCFAGLAPLLAKELGRLDATGITSTRLRNHDYLSFHLASGHLHSLRSMRLAEDIFLEVAAARRIERPSDIRMLSGKLNRQTILDAISLKNSIFRVARAKKRPSYVCFVRQDRDHRVSRRRISQRIEASLAAAFPRWRLSDPADLEFWVFWARNATLTLRLSDESLKYRCRPPPRRAAALRPTVAAAMVELAEIDDSHVVLDPLCGTGTLLLEGSLRHPNARFVGSDRSAEATALACRRLGDRAEIRQCELTALKYAPASFDRVISNLPWGRQFKVGDALYTDGIATMLDWTTAGGLLVLLTPRSDLIEPTLRRLRAKWKATRVLVQGRWASIYVIRKQSDSSARTWQRPPPRISTAPVLPVHAT